MQQFYQKAVALLFIEQVVNRKLEHWQTGAFPKNTTDGKRLWLVS
jgi:hypothetical protein